MTQIFLPGRKPETVAGHDALPDHLDDIFDFEIIAETRLSTERGGASDGDPKSFEVDDTDIVEVEFADGLKMWQSVEAAKLDFASPTTRSAQELGLLIPRQVRFSGASAQSRGLGTYIVRAVRILRGKAVGNLGALTARKVAEKIEEKPLLDQSGKRKYDHGLLKCDRRVVDGKGQIELSKITGKITASKPSLVFLHGTFSSTQGSFGDLAAAPKADVWDKLRAAYPGGIYALEHRTVTQSPIENAIDAAKALPKNARVSFVTHSRGGLVGELLCRSSRADISETGAIDDLDINIFEAFEGDLHGAQAKALQELRTILAEKTLRVEKCVRVAGPIAGTTIASDRLDRYMSVALNVFELVPALNTTGIAELIKSFLMGFIRTKADPNQLAGLEAMRPTSPMVRMLNRSDVAYSSNLKVVAGDTERSGILRSLVVLSADLFFKGDHDFVVDSASMSRGGERQSPSAPVLDRGPEVTHFSYFSNVKTRREIVNAAIKADSNFLTRSSASLSFTGKVPEEMKMPSLVGRSGDLNSPVCFLLPGIMGSHLSHDDKWTWLNPVRMATGGLNNLAIDKKDVEADGSIRKYYGRLAKYLARTHHVIPFDYDWRLSLMDQGHVASKRKLGKLVREQLDRTDQPIRFLAHSMGGLVVRALFKSQPELMDEVKARKGSRLVMLGTPNGGSLKITSTLLGRDPSIRQLEMIDLKNDMTEVLTTISAMPGPLELLPIEKNGLYMSSKFWEDMHRLDSDKWVVPDAADLKKAWSARKAIETVKLDPEFACYVAGVGKDLTLSSIKLDPSKEGKRRIQFFGTPQGDGTVTWKSGIPDGITPWYMDAAHGDMARTKQAFPALLDLLETGKTSRLSRAAPDVSRGGRLGDDPVEIFEDPIELFPRPDDVIDGFMGASALRDAVEVASEVVQTNVTLVHGDLRFASYPVAVGHYAGDPMMGAEAALDACLANHLSKVRDLGIYPGPLDTCEVVLRPECAPTGALVVGLGEYGKLAPGNLTQSIRQALLRYGLVQQSAALRSGGEPGELGLSTLIIGHLGSNITMQQSIASVLEAVAEANRALGDSPIRHLEIIELFEDRAFQAASVLEHARTNGAMGTQFTFDGEVRRVSGARVRASYGRQSDWWQRITVTEPKDKKGQLKFIAVSEAGRNEFHHTKVPLKVLKDLLIQHDTGTHTSQDVRRMLFELLVPLPMKSFAKENHRQLLVLDEATAVYPWELMEDNFAAYDFTRTPGSKVPDIKPMVVRAPVIRQLITDKKPVPLAKSSTALVVGDPQNDDGLAPLPGAVDEAKSVTEMFEKEAFDVHALIQPDRSMDVLKAMMLQPKKIIHLAGHGLPENPVDGLPGMVLPGGVYLTADFIDKMRYVPEFVFLNCCHIGKIGKGVTQVGTDVSQIASSLSVALIKKGVRAVVAAGWEIDDGAAKLFAESFYKEMLAGRTFGEAVFQGRVKVYDSFPLTNTWGAYQCYGDPDYCLREASGKQSSGTSAKTYYSVEQATKVATNIAVVASSALKKRTYLLSKLAEVESAAKEDWRTNSNWCIAMGEAFACLEEHNLAIDYLSRATGSLRAMETVQNLNVIRDTHLVLQASKSGRTKALRTLRRSVKASIKMLDGLDKLAGQTPSEERYALRGSAMKRLAWAETDKRLRRTALTKMVEYYEKAMATSKEAETSRMSIYPSINWIAGHVFLGTKEMHGASIDVWLDRLKEEAIRKDKEHPNFWSGICTSEVEILRGIENEDLATQHRADEISAGFKRAWVRGGSFRQSRSLRDQFGFLTQMIDPKQIQLVVWLEKIENKYRDLTSALDD